MMKFTFDRDDSLLMVIDIQERLFQAMDTTTMGNLKKNCAILLQISGEFNIPVIVTEQYRKGLGETIPELQPLISGAMNLEKLYFDCMKDNEIKKTVEETGKKTVIVTGIESHICVFQTALSLLSQGYKVIIAKDAVGSRRKEDLDAALASLSIAGALVYPAETIAFMILEKAGTPEFKKLSPLFK